MFLRVSVIVTEIMAAGKAFETANVANLEAVSVMTPRWEFPLTEPKHQRGSFMSTAYFLGIFTAMIFLAASPVAADQVEILVELVEVKCGNTEDVTGADEFYIISAFTGGTSASSNSSITRPISINDGGRKLFPESDCVMIHARIPASGKLVGALRAYDEDYAKTWETMRTTVGKATKAISAAAEAAGSDEDVKMAETLEAGFEVYDGMASLDSDDVLGEETLIIRAGGPSEEILTWKMVEEGLGFSTWEYTVTYRITRSR